MSRITCWSLILAALAPLAAEEYSPGLYAGLRWRMIGPFRAGRTVAAAGIPSQPNVFYVAANNGGVWKTDDAGRTWRPIFDGQPTGSVGALAIAPSDPSIIYLGSGEGLQRPDLSVGDGIYKSTDGGKTWRRLGLREGQQIPAILVDPRDPNRVFVAVLGHPYGPNAERGVFRSTDGGETWQKVLYKDENTGAVDLAFDPTNPRTVYAVLWAARQGPWENGEWEGPGSGLFQSTDGGDNWRQLTGGLPTPAEGLGRIGIAIAPSDPRRMYALVEARPSALYRSDDAGANWNRENTESRITGRGSDFAGVRVDPNNKDVIYVANTSTYRSSDAGQTFTAIKGAPGGDDYHTIWINPLNPQIILLAADQGATISVNGGQTWSSWYNQPTAQFYHVITDHRFPYWVYGGQQESGSAGVASRSDYGQITFRDWHPVGVEEYGYVAPDPLNPNIIYGGKVSRFNQTTGEVQQVGPAVLRGGKYRFLRSMPLIFSPVDPHVLYLGSQVLFKSINGGHSWDVISPDLTREKYDVPPSVGVFTEQARREATRRGVIYAIAPSHKDVNVIWAGTDDGLIQVTRDGGKSWKNITPPALTPWSKIAQLDASHFDDLTAYAAVNRFRLDDLKPHIYRTHDGGATWKEIVAGLPDGPVNTVREDPVRKGLLFAGTELAVYVSFDDGDHWQPLRLNMPAISVRDLVIHGNDVVAGTHGRGFWILDEIAPLRQISGEIAASEAHLFRPSAAYRVRWNENTDTPLPPEEPAGENPPDGAIVYYYLKAAASTPVTLEVFDAARKLVRRYSSDDKPDPIDLTLNVETAWVRPAPILAAEAGMHRFVWDLHYPPPDALRHEYPIAAIYHDTPRYPVGAIAMPGRYTLRLTAGGRTYTQALTVKMDPRVKTPLAGLLEQFRLATRLTARMHDDYQALQEVRALRTRLQSQDPELEKQAAAIEGGPGGRPSSDEGNEGLARLNGELATALEVVEGADATPTTQAVAAVADLERKLDALLGQLRALKAKVK
ncbi:MAG TPA: glycoside hydrolase [Bryobacteraceae bacterium]|nr:glycoside hydrolase [Bryobacteraceae bacterium]